MSISKLHNRILAIMITLSMVLSLSVVDVHAAGGGSIKLENYSKPSRIEMGQGFGIWGKIKANKKIDKVEIGIVSKKTGKWVMKYTKKNVNKKTFRIVRADKKLKFGTLKAGKYYYRINVKLKGKKKKRVLNKKFTVVDSSAGSEKATADSGSDTDNEKASPAQTQTKPPEIKLSNFRSPASRNIGTAFIPKGIVTCSSKIKKVEVGIVFEPTNKWTEYKYKKLVWSKSFDLSNTYPTLRFDKLAAGTYYYRMYVHTAEGVYVVFNKKFTVRPSNKPQMAVNWAIDIANDDSFTYGKKPIANAIGCYFCGTNGKKVKRAKKKKMKNPERYEKTYVCMTFVGAAYAHGAGDPEILDQCQRARMTLYETNDNFKQFSCWMKIGSCKDLTINDLQPGDVIIKWSIFNDNNGHACMYIGGNDLVEASGGGWGPNSIAVKEGVAAARLASLSGNSKNYVMRYRH